jgi:hypothetical protein
MRWPRIIVDFGDESIDMICVSASGGLRIAVETRSAKVRKSSPKVALPTYRLPDLSGSN